MLVCSTVYKPNDLSLAENNPFTFHFSLHVSTSVDWFDSCFVSCRWHGESCELLRWRSLECKQTRLCLDHWCLLHLNWKTLMSLPLELPSRELPKASKWWTLATRTGFELSCFKPCRVLSQCCYLESVLSRPQGILLSLCPTWNFKFSWTRLWVMSKPIGSPNWAWHLGRHQQSLGHWASLENRCLW